MTTKALERLAQLQARVLVGRGEFEYVLLAGLGLIPIFLAGWIGAGADIQLAPDTELYACCAPENRLIATGFHQRANWVIYPLLLPVALWSLRWLMRTAFGRDRRPGRTNALFMPQYRAIRSAISNALFDYKILVVASLLSLVVCLVDFLPAFLQHTRWAGSIGECPRELDWGWFHLATGDVTPNSVLLLKTLAFGEQCVLIALGLMAFGGLLAYNRAYLRSVYIRSRDRERVDERFILRIDQGDRKFGLSAFNQVFNKQLMFLSVAGVLMLVSRYANVERDAGALALRLWYWMREIVTGDTAPPLPKFNIADLLPDFGQWMLVLTWIGLVVVVLLPAKIKLLPLRHGDAVNSAESYLREFYPVGCDLPGSVEDVAEEFRRHDFWPCGDVRARELLWACSFVCLILVFPVKGVDTGGGIAALVVMAIASKILASLIMSYHRHKLRRVSPILVDDQ